MSFFDAEILIAGSELIELNTSIDQIIASGFCAVDAATSLQEVVQRISTKHFSLIFIDETWGHDDACAFDIVAKYRHLLQHTKYVVLTSDPTTEKFYLGAISGIFDYLMVGATLHLGREANRMLSEKNRLWSKTWKPEKIGELGFFRTLGLTKREIEILIEYLRDFPRQNELSSRVEKSPPQLRKAFSNIYTKLSISLAVDNPAQLASLLTIGAFYRTAC